MIFPSSLLSLLTLLHFQFGCFSITSHLCSSSLTAHLTDKTQVRRWWRRHLITTSLVLHLCLPPSFRVRVSLLPSCENRRGISPAVRILWSCFPPSENFPPSASSLSCSIQSFYWTVPSVWRGTEAPILKVENPASQTLQLQLHISTPPSQPDFLKLAVCT